MTIFVWVLTICFLGPFHLFKDAPPPKKYVYRKHIVVGWLDLILFCKVSNTLIMIILFRLADDVVFSALKVCVKESSKMILQCGTMDDEAFQSLATKHPVSQP